MAAVLLGGGIGVGVGDEEEELLEVLEKDDVVVVGLVVGVVVVKDVVRNELEVESGGEAIIIDAAVSHPRVVNV
jgi:hypothetical protein